MEEAILSRTDPPARGTAMRFGTTLIPASLFCLVAILAQPAQAGPLGATLAPVAEAPGSAVCIDPWRKTRPCRPAASLLSTAAHRTDQANRWLLSLWSTAGEVAAGPRLILSGKRVSCGDDHGQMRCGRQPTPRRP